MDNPNDPFAEEFIRERAKDYVMFVSALVVWAATFGTIMLMLYLVVKSV